MIELTLDPKKWTEKERKDPKKAILQSVGAASDVRYPGTLSKTSGEYIFCYYERIKK